MRANVTLRGAVAGLVTVVFAASCGGDGGGAKPPTELHPVKLAFSAAVPQVNKITTIQALDTLKTQGHEVTTTYLQQSEDPVQAVVRGDVNFGSASASAVFAAIGQGIPIKAVVQANGPDYAMVAPARVSGPAGLDGLRVGIHAKVSSTALYTNVLLEKNPNVHPKILVLPGSANRIRALAAGQLDASVVQLSDLPALEKLAPGKFHVIFDVAQQRPDLIDAVIFTRADLLKNDPSLVRQFITAQLQANRHDYLDVKGLAAAIAKNVPETSQDLAEQLARLYTDSKIWPNDGGLTQADVQSTLKALTTSELLKQAPTADACCDRSPLDQVLKKIGKYK